jgi:thiamine biosynthesis lipoprotein
MLRTICISILFIAFSQCGSSGSDGKLVTLTGVTMGNIPYNIKYYHAKGTSFKSSIDSLLEVWNLSLSTYIPESEISRFNRDSCHEYESEYFYPVLVASREVYEKTNGAFDPTVGPLVNAWGFGPEQSLLPDSTSVDSLRKFVGFDKIHFDSLGVCKEIIGMELDFSAVAKGYAVDVLADFLGKRGIENMLVEIGGELICLGKKPGGEPWKTAIEDPTVEVYERKLLAIAELSDRAIATSGNYRNYYVRDGKRYVHTINPKTGYPVTHSLLSASVFAGNCTEADAYATGFMVLGLDKAKKILARNRQIDAYLIFENEQGKISTFITEGIAGAIKSIDIEN